MAAAKRSGDRLGAGKRFSYALQAGALFGTLGLFRLLPLDTASNLGGWLGRTVFWRAMRKPSTIANMRIAFPELTDAEAEALVRAMADNMVRTVAETAHLPRFTAENGRIHVEGAEHVQAAMARGKPIVVVSGHFGNFEVIFPAMLAGGLRTAAVTRPPNNPYVADWLEKTRRRVGMSQQFPKGPEGTRQIYRHLRAGGNLSILIDQHLAEGIPVPLFDRPAMTGHTPATLALEFGATILPIAVRRDAGARFTATFHQPIVVSGGGSPASETVEITAALNRFVEAEVRARPGHWLWMHSRWKPTPELSRRAQKILTEAGTAAPPATGVSGQI